MNERLYVFCLTKKHKRTNLMTTKENHKMWHMSSSHHSVILCHGQRKRNSHTHREKLIKEIIKNKRMATEKKENPNMKKPPNALALEY